jgi:selenocysteine-specific elongation factor
VAVDPGDRCLHRDACDHLRAQVLDQLRGYFAKQPHRLFMPIAELRSPFLEAADRQVFDAVMRALADGGEITCRERDVGLAHRQPTLDPREQAAAERIVSLCRDGGLAPPGPAELCKQAGVTEDEFARLLTGLIDQGVLVRLSEKVVYLTEAHQQAVAVVHTALAARGGITVAELRDLLGVSRKHALALLEHLDVTGVTRRDGDRHVKR